MKPNPNAKRPYAERGTPEKNRRTLRRLRAYARGASRPGDRPNRRTLGRRLRAYERPNQSLRNPAYGGPDGIFAGYGEQGVVGGE